MDIVMICRDRPLLTEQTIRSLRENAADWSRHRLVVVVDSAEGECEVATSVITGKFAPWKAWICTGKQLGVGGAKNFGADCFPQNEPDRLLMFSDNDMMYLPRWDELLEIGMASRSSQAPDGVVQLGGWRHPFHQKGQLLMEGAWLTTDREHTIHEVDAVTGNCFVIKWSDWLKYGPFDANAIGPGQSEDFALSQKIKAGGGLVATLNPPVAIHCGLVNSSGEPATGWREMAEMARGQLLAMSESDRGKVKLEVPQWPGNVDVMETLAGIKPDSDPDPTTFRLARLPFTGMTACSICGPNTCTDPTHPRARIVPSQYTPGIDAEEGARRLNDAAVEMRLMHPATETPIDVIRPGKYPIGAVREVTLDEARKMYPHRDDDGLPIDGSWGSDDMRPVDPIPGPISLMGLRRELSLSEIAAVYPDPQGHERAVSPTARVVLSSPDGQPFRINDKLLPDRRVAVLGIDAARGPDEAAVVWGYTDPDGTTTLTGESHGPIKLCLGSGQKRFSNSHGWVNLDSQNVPPDRVPDIVLDFTAKPLPFPDGSVVMIVAEHCVEHMGCGESAPMLRECWRVLAPGGSLIITVPDMRALAGRWLGGELDTQLFMTNVYGAYMGDEADRHAWGGDMESWSSYLATTLPSGTVKPFDWRAIPGADVAVDWWILGMEVVK